MKQVKIQYNTFEYVERQTYQDDHAGGIIAGYDLYRSGNMIARLIEHRDDYTVYHIIDTNNDIVSYEFEKSEIKFL